MINLKKILQSRSFAAILCVTGGILVIVAVFEAGVFVGYRKAAFSYKWGDNYYRTFGGDNRRGFGGDFTRSDFSTAHGVAGKIIKVDLPKITVLGEDGIEKVVVVGDTTGIRRFRGSLAPKDLAVDDFVVVVGSPNDMGFIDAKLIRLLPMPQERTAASEEVRKK